MKKFNHFKDLPVALSPLPFDDSYLLPYMSRATIYYHYEKHHRNYVNKTLSLLNNSSNINLVDLIIQAKKHKHQELYNNSAQIFNHHIFWRSLQNGISHKERMIIETQWNSYEDFATEFINQGMAHFGSGWVWLLKNDEKLFIETSANGDIPDQVLNNEASIMTICDLWEHAYYIDYHNERNTFLQTFTNHLMKLI